MEYWSIEKQAIKTIVITPSIQYSNTPKLIEIEISQQILSCISLWNRKKMG